MIGKLNEEYGEPIWLKGADQFTHIINKNVIYSVGCLEGKDNIHIVYCHIVFEDEAAHIEFSNKLMDFEAKQPEPLGIPRNISGIWPT